LDPNFFQHRVSTVYECFIYFVLWLDTDCFCTDWCNEMCVWNARREAI
jgi:hypothetical protein